MSARHTISKSDARTIALNAQLLPYSTAGERSVKSVIDALGCIQIDAIRAVRRSHELVLLARRVPLADVKQLHEDSEDALHFESWGHAHSIISSKLWPALAWKRRLHRTKGLSGNYASQLVAKQILKIIDERGPSTLSDLDTRSKGSGWDRTSDVKTACEWLLSIGELICTNRNSRWQRVYRLPEAGLCADDYYDLDDRDGQNILIEKAMHAMGIATAEHVADYFRMPKDVANAQLHDGNYVRVDVEDTSDTWFLTESADLAKQDCTIPVPISPLDSLVWTRSRQLKLFQRDYILESYKPKQRRQFGYFGMPIVTENGIIGRIDAQKVGKALKIHNLETDGKLPAGMFEQMMAWTETDDLSTARNLEVMI